VASIPLTVAGSACIAMVAVLLLGRAPAAHIPMPRPRPPLPAVEAAPWPDYAPRVVKSIPITKPPPEAPEAVVARHEPPELYGPDPSSPRSVKSRTSHARESAGVASGRGGRVAPADRADICQRHRLRKVFTNNGRSWRCRR
jgi:hypothetical protein